MIYKAVVIDNADLFTRGTLRVRIAGLYNGNIAWNLQDDFDENGLASNRDDSAVFSNDYDAILFAPFGGGRNYGSFRVPQPNEKGIVTFLGGSKANPVWMGGLFEVTRDEENFDVEYVNFPTDKFEDGPNTDGVLEGEGNFDDTVETQEEKSFIIRTKHTTRESAEDLDFEQQNTSNIISVGKKKVRVTHFPENSWEAEDEESPKKPTKYIDFLLGLNEEGNSVINLFNKIIDEENGDSYSGIELKEDSGKIEIIKEGAKINEITFNQEEVRVARVNEENEDETSMVLNEEEGSISLIKGGEIKANLLLTETGLELQNNSGANKIIFNDGNEIVIENESGSTITMTSSGNIELMPNNEVHVLGDKDNLVRYADLEKIVTEFISHVHVAPSGPTGPALSSDQAPIIAKVKKPSIDMKSLKGKIL